MTNKAFQDQFSLKINYVFWVNLSLYHSKLYLQWCRLVSTERQYVAVLKGVEENYLPLLESSDVPSALRGKTESLFCNWKSLSAFHSQSLLPAMEGALSQTLQQTDCFSKYVSNSSHFNTFSIILLNYSYIVNDNMLKINKES